MTRPRYTDADIAEVSDNPEWTEGEFAEAKPFAEVFPDLAESLRHHGPRVTPRTKAVSLELDVEVLERFMSAGPDWQLRINQALRRAIGLGESN